MTTHTTIRNDAPSAALTSILNAVLATVYCYGVIIAGILALNVIR